MMWSAWTDISKIGLRKDTVTWLKKSEYQCLEDLKKIDRKDVFKIKGMGVIRGNDLLKFLNTLHINPVDFFRDKLRENDWDLFKVDCRHHLYTTMLILEVDPTALEMFERKYQVKIGSSFTEQTGILGMTPLSSLETRIEAENIWQVWVSRIKFIYNRLIDDLQKQQGNALERQIIE